MLSITYTFIVSRFELFFRKKKKKQRSNVEQMDKCNRKKNPNEWIPDGIFWMKRRRRARMNCIWKHQLNNTAQHSTWNRWNQICHWNEPTNKQKVLFSFVGNMAILHGMRLTCNTIDSNTDKFREQKKNSKFLFIYSWAFWYDRSHWNPTLPINLMNF